MGNQDNKEGYDSGWLFEDPTPKKSSPPDDVYEEREMDPEEARREAKLIHEEEVKIAEDLGKAEWIRSLGNNAHSNNSHLSCGIDIYRAAFPGFGTGHLHFFHSKEGNLKTWNVDEAVRTPNQLDVSVYIDEKTQAEAETKLSKTSLNTRTLYFVDEDGNELKLIPFVEGVHDPKDAVQTPNAQKMVPAKMTPGDTEVRGIAINILKKALNQTPNQSQATSAPETED